MISIENLEDITSLASEMLGSLRNDDADGNDDATKQ